MKAVQYVQKLKSDRSGRPKVETLGKPTEVSIYSYTFACLGVVVY